MKRKFYVDSDVKHNKIIIFQMDVKGCTQGVFKVNILFSLCFNVIKITEIELILMFMCCHIGVKWKFVASVCYKVEILR